MVSPALCADPTYVEMRTRRMALAEWKSDRLEDYCGDFHPIRRAARSTRVQRYLVFIGQLSLRFRIVVASLNCICKSQRGNR
jgi:hypothetical protein